MYKIKFEYRGIKYDMNFTGRVSVVEGNSGTGKTKFSQDLAMWYMRHKMYGKVVVFNYTNKFTRESAVGKGKILVIDNADIQLGKEEIEAINRNVENQYIIFGRSEMAGLRVAISDNYYITSKGKEITVEKIIKEDV
jgi:hypothetical protein